MNNRYPYDPEGRFQQPNSLKQVISPYDQDSRLFQDLEQRGILPTKTFTVTLTAAGSLLIDEPGFHFCVYGREFVSGNPVLTTVFLNAYINQKSDAAGPGAAFPARHGRGFSGPFSKVFFTWTAQAGSGGVALADIVIFKGSNKPWIDGEAPT